VFESSLVALEDKGSAKPRCGIDHEARSLQRPQALKLFIQEIAKQMPRLKVGHLLAIRGGGRM
jgi:hypothetical protein